MVSEPLLWPFLSSLVFISVTPFSTSLPPSQQPPHPFTVEPPSSSSRRPWVPDLQPPLLRSFTLHRPLPLASPLQTLLRLRFWSYHRNRLALIYKTVKDSTSSETAHAPTRRQNFLYGWSCAPRVARTLHAPPRACFLLLKSALVTSSATSSANIICWRHLTRICWRHRLTRPLTCVDFDSGLTFSVQVLLTQFFM